MYQMQLSHLMHNSDLNKRGVCGIIGVPKAGVESMPDLLSIMQQPSTTTTSDFYAEQIVLKAGYSWQRLLPDYNINLSFEEEDKMTSHNGQHTYKVPIPYPTDNFERAKVVRTLEGHEWILIVKERTGAWRVIGSMERGAIFNSKFETGTVRKDANKYDAAFTWEVGGRRAFYTQAFDLSNWFMIQGNNFIEHWQLDIDEPIVVEYAPGVFEYYLTPVGVLQRIQHTHTMADWNYKVYHNNKAKRIIMPGDGFVNTSITAVTNILPATLEEFTANDNDITNIPLWNNVPSIQTVHLENNNLPDNLVENLLDDIDAYNTNNGEIYINGQTPPAVPGGPSAANLISRGWTVVTD